MNRNTTFDTSSSWMKRFDASTRRDSFFALIGNVETIQHHDFLPSRDEVHDHSPVTVGRSVDFRDASQLRVAAEDKIVASCSGQHFGRVGELVMRRPIVVDPQNF